MDAKSQRILNIYETGVSETELTETLKTKIDASTGGSLGSIKPTDSAPTPARNGNYTFSIGGGKPAWLTAEAGITTVKAGDGVAVVYAAPNSYTYTHLDTGSPSIALDELNKKLSIEPQILTDSQKLQTRENIGVVDTLRTTTSTQNSGLHEISFGNNLVGLGYGGDCLEHTQKVHITKIRFNPLKFSLVEVDVPFKILIAKWNALKTTIIADRFIDAVITKKTGISEVDFYLNPGEFLFAQCVNTTNKNSLSISNYFQSYGAYKYTHTPNYTFVSAATIGASASVDAKSFRYDYSYDYSIVSNINILNKVEENVNSIEQELSETTIKKVGFLSLNSNNNVSGGFYNNWEALDVDVHLTKIRFNPNRIAALVPQDILLRLLIASWNVDKTNLVVDQIKTLTLLEGESAIDITDNPILVKAGSFAIIERKEVAAIAGGTLFTSYLQNNGTTSEFHYFLYNLTWETLSTKGITDYALEAEYEFEFKSSLLASVSTKVDSLQTLESSLIDDFNTVSNENCTTVLLEGSSLTETYHAPRSHSWVERLNDIVDHTIVNNGRSGYNLIGNINDVVKNIALNTDATNTPLGVKPKAILWGNSANATRTGVDGHKDLLIAKEATQTLGAVMLIGSEEDYAGISTQYESMFINFAREENLEVSLITSIWRKLFPSTNPYLGFLGSNHSGYRVQSPYISHKEIIETVPIEKNVKLYKVRPKFKAGSPLISDFIFDSNTERLKYFTAITPGTKSDTSTSIADNLDNGTYAPTGGIVTGVKLSEESYLLRGGDISFNKFALCEFILNKISVSKGDLSIGCSVAPTTLYISITRNTATVDANSNVNRTIWESVPFTYANGVVQAKINRAVADIQLYDKIRFIVECPGVFALNSPKFENFDGRKKTLSKGKSVTARQYGTELNPSTSFPTTGHGFYLSDGAAVKSLPVEIANYTAYNTVKSHLEIPNDTSYASKTITLNQETRKVAIRIIAQNFYPISTNRYVGTSLETNEYITNSVNHDSYDYDYATLKLTIGGIYKEYLVPPGWIEIYDEIDFCKSTNEVIVTLAKKSLIDSNYSNHNAKLMIHDVSIQKII